MRRIKNLRAGTVFITDAGLKLLPGQAASVESISPQTQMLIDKVYPAGVIFRSPKRTLIRTILSFRDYNIVGLVLKNSGMKIFFKIKTSKFFYEPLTLLVNASYFGVPKILFRNS